MTRAGASILVLFAVASAGCAVASESPETPPGLDMTRCYWRYHWTFRPAEFLGLDGALHPLPTRFSGLNTSPTANLLFTEGPPDGWFAPEFADEGWAVQRMPMPFLPEVEQDSDAATGIYPVFIIRRMCARTRFRVNDPATLRGLRLDLAYHGGVIVYLNGKEVARGHIPASDPLAQGDHAEPYPVGAYRPENAEQEAWGLMGQGGVWSQLEMGKAGWRWLVEKKPEFKEKYEHAQQIREIRVRHLNVAFPVALLKPGLNVLAVENRCSPIPELRNAKEKSYLASPGMGNVDFAHVGLGTIRLTADPAGAVASTDTRPEGVQAWAEDIHRWILEEDFLEPGVNARQTVQLVGTRGGTYSGQVIVGTSHNLSHPAVELSDLRASGGAVLPKMSAEIRWARTIDLKSVKDANPGVFRTHSLDLALMRYRKLPFFFGGHRDRVRDAWAKSHAPLGLFDRLSPEAPESIAAGTCQPVWLTCHIPSDALPGSYRGKLKIRADGMAEVEFDVTVEVGSFTMPAPEKFRQYVGIDESPWALAKACNVPVWSEPHWRLVEQSIRAAGQLGARIVNIPVILGTEVGNENDTLVKWIKKDQGTYTFDFSVADRYLALWKEYGHPESDAIVYLAKPSGNSGQGGGPGSVNVLDPDTGSAVAFEPPKPETPEGRRQWVDCARAVVAHLKTHGFDEARIHWGLFEDYAGSANIEFAKVLKAEIPGVGWARSSHEGRAPFKSDEGKVTWQATVRGYQAAPFGGWNSIKGKPNYYREVTGYTVQANSEWSNPNAFVLLPRADSDVCALQMYPPLFQLRTFPELVTTSKYRGFGRICVDGWGRGGYFGPFTPYLLYPGASGKVDGSIQFEVLREGIQEAETRIALMSAERSQAVKDLLARRTERVWIMPVRVAGQRIAECYGGWQVRSRALYEAASGK